MSSSVFVFNDLMWGMVVRFVDIGGIVDYRYLNLSVFFKIITMDNVYYK